MKSFELTSLGIDIGSTTTHQVLSRLTLSQSVLGSSRYEVTKREILRLGVIHETPLIHDEEINIEQVSRFLLEELNAWRVSPEEIDSGAVIITGEAARKANASKVLSKISLKTGKFISAVAGPNYESILAALGSSIKELSGKLGRPILNVDIGGGTSNLAVVSPQGVSLAACVNVGGRLVWMNDKEFHFTRVGAQIFKEYGFSRESFEQANHKERLTILDKFARKLVLDLLAFIRGNEINDSLVVTRLPGTIKTSLISITGGVGELLYSDDLEHLYHENPLVYNDMGVMIAHHLKTLLLKEGFELIEPTNKIRATVIGAGAFTLNVSGNTTFLDEHVHFPIRNQQVIPLYLDKQNLTEKVVATQVLQALQTWGYSPTAEGFALYLEDSIFPAYDEIMKFVKGLELVFKERLAPLLVVFREDLANSAGNILKRETRVKFPVLFIDEITLREGDYLDVNHPLTGTLVFPVTVKSLIFNT